MDINKTIQLAVKYHQAGNLQRAESLYRKILKRQPNNADVLHMLGVINSQLGHLDFAISCIRKSLQFNMNNAYAHYNLGNAFRKKGDIDTAFIYYQKALQLNPAFVSVYYNLGNVHEEKGQLDDAIAYYEKALQLNPALPEAYCNLGNVLQKKGQLDDAITYYEKALQLDPAFPEAYCNVGNIFKAKGQLDEAITCYQKAIQCKPDYVDAHNNLGIAFEEKGQLDEAVNCYQKAVQLDPNSPESYINLGSALYHKGQLDRAISFFQKALSINPDFAKAYNALGVVLKDKGCHDEAEKSLKRALQLKPDFPICYSNLLLTLNYSSHHTPEAVFAEHLKFAKQFAEPFASAILPHTNDRSPSRRLRIGYVSPDFRRHSVNYFLEPVLSSHDHDQFEIFCYSDVIIPDAVTERLHGYADKWRDIKGMPDEKAAELIRKDGIDILIDLAGHTGYNRMLLFARKPAPVQVSWIGYPNTTGLSTMDYRIVDGYTDPPGLTDPFYTEKLIRMPECFLCYQPDKDSPDVAASPCLTSGHITFGSFNNFAKETPDVLALWAEILQRVSGSRLILKAKSLSDHPTREYVMELFRQQGIDAGRIELLCREASFTGHLDLYNRIDIGFDPFPYNGTTTTCEALWMGVPVITLKGNEHASRVGVSLLSNIGLEELIAKTREEYIKIAFDLASDMSKLKSIHGRLRNMMAQSPLTNAKQFTSYLENCFSRIWEAWRCQNNTLSLHL